MRMLWKTGEETGLLGQSVLKFLIILYDYADLQKQGVITGSGSLCD